MVKPPRKTGLPEWHEEMKANLLLEAKQKTMQDIFHIVPSGWTYAMDLADLTAKVVATEKDSGIKFRQHTSDSVKQRWSLEIPNSGPDTIVKLGRSIRTISRLTPHLDWRNCYIKAFPPIALHSEMWSILVPLATVKDVKDIIGDSYWIGHGYKYWVFFSNNMIVMYRPNELPAEVEVKVKQTLITKAAPSVEVSLDMLPAQKQKFMDEITAWKQQMLNAVFIPQDHIGSVKLEQVPPLNKSDSPGDDLLWMNTNLPSKHYILGKTKWEKVTPYISSEEYVHIQVHDDPALVNLDALPKDEVEEIDVTIKGLTKEEAEAVQKTYSKAKEKAVIVHKTTRKELGTKSEAVVVWPFESGSMQVNGEPVMYKTQLNKDGTTSCNCMGWTMGSAKAVGGRRCKHTDAVKTEAAIIFKKWKSGESLGENFELVSASAVAGATSKTLSKALKTKPIDGDTIFKVKRVVEI